MSRIGKNPISVPQGVEVLVSGRDLTVKGKNGRLSWTVPYEVKVAQEDNQIVFTPKNQNAPDNAKWGMARAMTANMVHGVTEGFSRGLELHGVGYRAAVQGKKLTLSVGYSNPKEVTVPEGLEVSVADNTQITVKGADKQKVGQFAAEVRAIRPPEPYKGKGIRYSGEHIVMKEGKKK